ncbi:hypothetical protein SFUMM280S_09531 [Streptomyces fumanus]
MRSQSSSDGVGDGVGAAVARVAASRTSAVCAAVTAAATESTRRGLPGIENPPYSWTALDIPSALDALLSPGTGAGPSFWEKLSTFQSPSVQRIPSVMVNQSLLTGLVDFSPAVPNTPVHQTSTVVVVPEESVTLVPIGVVRET